MPLPSIPDYSNCIKTPALVHPSVLNGGHPVEKGVRLIKYSGGFCVVFPYQTATKKYAVRCWHAEVSNAKRRTQIIAKALRESNLPYFVGFDFYEDGIMTPLGIQPIVVMDWVEAKSLKQFLAEHITESNVINEIAENFKKMVADLHACHFSHGDLQHGNIMIKPDHSLVLVDYDSMYVPELKGMPDEIKGLAGYQHEARWKNKQVSEKADYFSELVIYLSLKALAKRPSLWNELNMEDTETLLFSGEDIQSKGTTNIFKLLKKDCDLASLADKLCEFMAKSSIEDLKPLEDVVVSKSEGIATKWKISKGEEETQKELSALRKEKDLLASQIKGLKTELKRIQDKFSSEKKHLSEITRQKGYEILNLRRDNEQLKEKITELVHGKKIRERIIGLSVAFIAILFVFLLGPTIKNLVSQKPSDGTDIFPQELSGDYMVRKMNGADGIDDTIKIYCEGEAEGDGYVMKVYSASITQNYSFTYNPTNGEIKSTELGKGRARVKKFTKETEITFTGWEIIK